MNDHPSPMGYMEDERSSSPKRRKIRQKYAPKACVSCRRSKLKCSGDNPCQRCIDNGKRCFYSEDQTAAEVLQNLSRPTHAPASQPSFSNTKSNNNSNSNNSNSSGNGASRLNVIPQNGASERRPSDTGVGGLTMEERMARMEAMLEMLMQERGMTFPPNGGLEREESVGFRSESAFPLPLLDPIHPALEQMTQHSSEQMQHTLLAEDAAFASDASSFVRAGNQNLPFPDSARYQQYVSQFFIDLFPRHPCIDQADFASRTQRIITDGATETSDIYFLALCYAIFACCDAVPQMHDAAASSNDKPPGWHWYQLADSLVDAKKELQSSCEVLAPMQSFLFQALYLTYADMPALAHATIRPACTIILQRNLYQQSAWTKCRPSQVYWGLCVVWNMYISDRTISLSCGKPFAFLAQNMNIEFPTAFCNRIEWVAPQSVYIHHNYDIDEYLQQKTRSVRLATSTFTKIPRQKTYGDNSDAVDLPPDLAAQFGRMALLDNLFSLPFLSDVSRDSPGGVLSEIGKLTVPLFTCRGIIVAFNLNLQVTKYLADVAKTAILTISRIHDFPDAFLYKHQLTSILAGSMLVLGVVILRNPPDSHMEVLQRTYIECIELFVLAVSVLLESAHTLHYARRVFDDFSAITDVVMRIREKWYLLDEQQQDALKNTFAAELIPPGIIESFPYQEPDDEPTKEGEEAGRSGFSVLWFF